MSRKTVLLFPGQGAYRGKYATALEHPSRCSPRTRNSRPTLASTR